MHFLQYFRFTLNEVLISLKENELNASKNEHKVQVTLLLPSENGLTDQDSNNSDNEVTGTFMHLPRRILTTEAESRAVTASFLATACGSPPRPKKKSKKNPRKGTTGISISLETPQTYGPSIDGFLDFSISTFLDPFFEPFSLNLKEDIATQTIVYPQQRRNINFSLTKEELICFIRILLVSGYYSAPFHGLYYSNQLVAESMRRNRFKEILQYLHFADNSRITSHRYYRIRPLFTEIDRKFKTFFSALTSA